jgi:hypothetical protein
LIEGGPAKADEVRTVPALSMFPAREFSINSAQLHLVVLAAQVFAARWV